MSNENHGTGDDHSCHGKAREIERRLKMPLGLDVHDIITEMCKLWGTQNADEFWERMNSMSDDQLRAAVEEAKLRLQRKKVKKFSDMLQEQMITPYA